ncbi:hypothetical protein D3C81_2002850 [compost metagenome]
MPRISVMAATGMMSWLASVAVSTISAAPATPAPPLEVISRITSRLSCWPHDKSMFSACARNNEAMVR